MRDNYLNQTWESLEDCSPIILKKPEAKSPTVQNGDLKPQSSSIPIFPKPALLIDIALMSFVTGKLATIQNTFSKPK